MKVISKAISKDVNGKNTVWYKFDTGHEYRMDGFDIEWAYTKSGNYASIPTMRKLAQFVSKYEDQRIQIQD